MPRDCLGTCRTVRVSEATQERPGLKCKIIGLINEKKERDSFYLACSPIDAPETAALIAIRNMNIHQYDSSDFLVPHVPSILAIDRTYPYHASH